MRKGIDSFKKGDRNDLEKIVATLKEKGFRIFLHASSLHYPRDKDSPIIISLDTKIHELSGREKQVVDMADYAQAILELQREGATITHCGSVSGHLCKDPSALGKLKYFSEEMTIVSFEKIADIKQRKKFQILIAYDEHKTPFKFLELNHYKPMGYLEM